MVIVAYCMTSGREVLFAIYIPLDILLNLSAVLFFWYERYKDKVKKDRIKNKEKIESAIAAAEEAMEDAVDNYTSANKLENIKDDYTKSQV